MAFVNNGDDLKNKLNGIKNQENYLDGKENNDTIKGANLNDTIIGGAGNDVITGGTGKTTLVVEGEFGNDIVNLTKGEEIVIDANSFGTDSASYQIVKNDVVINLGTGSITLKNFAKKDVTDGVSINLSNETKYFDTSSFKMAHDFNKNATFKGTWLNEVIDASLTEQKFDKKKNPLSKGVNINTGAGNDEIIGSKFNDTITGGIGKNTITYDVIDFGKDIVNITKGEELIIDANKLGDANYQVVKNDLVINFGGESSITLKNFAKKNVAESVVVNGKDIVNKTIYMSHDFNKNATFKGTWLNEVINADDAAERFDRKGKSLGVNINAGAGNDEITGSKFNDTITGGTGENTIKFSTGNDIVNITKGEDLILDCTSFDSAEYKFDKNNLVISFGEDSITLKNFAKKDVATSNGSVILKLANGEIIDLRNDVFAETTQVTGKTFKGKWYSESIDASNIETALGKNDKGVNINAGAGNDFITGSQFNDTITGGTGENIINVDLKTCKEKGLTFGNDIVNLTKGEKLILNIIAEEDATNPNAVNPGNYAIKTNGKDYTITFYQNSNLIQDESGNYVENTNDIIGSITFKDFAAKDILGAQGSLIIKVNDFEMDLVKEIYTIGQYSYEGTIVNIDTIFNNDWVKTGVIKGTRISESINAIQYEGVGKKAGKGVTINAGAGNDNIVGSNYNDTIKGGNGNDTLCGGTGNDILYGEAGNDTYQFNVGAGNDTIYAGKGEDTIKLEMNTLAINSIEQVFSKGKGTKDLVISYGDDGDTVTIKDYFTVDKKGNVTGVKSTITKIETLDGVVSIEDIRDLNTDNIITETTAKSKIYGFKGNDTINTAGGESTIVGGQGDDVINTKRYAVDNFVFNNGDGNDTIAQDFDTLPQQFATTKTDNISLTGVDKDGFTAEIKGNDVVITYNDGKDSVTIKDYLLNSDNTRDFVITTKDGETTSLNDVLNANLKSEVSADATIGTVGADEITETTAKSEIYGFYGNDTINTAGGESTIVGGQGDDLVNTKRYAVDNFVFNNGDGNDTIAQDFDTLPQQFATTKTDNISLTGVDKDGFTAEIKGNDVVLSYNDGKDSVTIKDYLLNSDNTRDFAITTKDGETTSLNDVLNANLKSEVSEDATVGTVGADEITETTAKSEIYGFYGNDTINTAGGESTIVGGQGDDVVNTYRYAVDKLVFNNGDGHDIVNQLVDTLPPQFATTKTDNISLTGVDKDGFTAEIKGNDVVITYNDGKDSVTIKDYIINEDNLRDFAIATKDGVVTSLKDILVLDINGTDEADTIEGSSLNENIKSLDSDDYINAGAGNDTINGGAGYDIIEGGTGNDQIDGGEGDSYILGQEGNDTITGGADYDCIEGGDGADVIYGNAGNDYLIGDLGADTINGGAGNDTIIASTYLGATKPEGVKTVTDYYSHFLADDNAKTIEGGTGNDVIWGSNGADTINGGDGNDKVYAFGANSVIDLGNGDDLVNSYQNTAKTIHAGAGNDTISIEYGKTTVTGGLGNDSIWGGYVSDSTIIFAEGDGNDTYKYRGYTTSSGSGTPTFCNDTLVFENTSLTDMVGKQDGNNLVLTYGEDSSVTILDYYKDGVNSADWNVYVQIDDGKQLLSEMIKSMNFVINGTDADDYLVGGYGKDTIYGGDGNDEITAGIDTDDDTWGSDIAGNYVDGGKGEDWIYGSNQNDTLKGGEGNDYIWTMGGNDEVYGGEGHDALVAEAGGSSELYGETGNDLIEVKYDGDIANGGDGDDELHVGYKGIDTNVYGKEINATVNGGNGDDVISIFTGGATVKGEAGNDTIWGSRTAGSNIIFANGGGNDVYKYMGQDDVLVFENVETSSLVCEFVENTRSDKYYSYNEEDRWTESSAKTHKDLVIKYGENQSVAIEDYTTDMNIYIQTADGKQLLSEAFGNINMVINGTAEADTIVTWAGNDIINGGLGNDNIQSGAGNDSIEAGLGDDFVNAGEGNDIINGGLGNDEIYGDEGDDTINGGMGDDMLWGGAGHDSIETGNGTDIVYAGIGNDTISAVNGDNYIEAQDGDDVIYADGGKDSIYAGNGSDTIEAGTQDTVLAGDGDDVINVGYGQNQIYGDAGNDVITSGHGNDYIQGDAGNDIFNISNDWALKADYADVMSNSTIKGGIGDDTFNVGKGTFTVDLTGGEGADFFNISDTWHYDAYTYDANGTLGICKGSDITINDFSAEDTIALRNGAINHFLADGHKVSDTNYAKYSMFFDITVDAEGNGTADLSKVMLALDDATSVVDSYNETTGKLDTSIVIKTADNGSILDAGKVVFRDTEGNDVEYKFNEAFINDVTEKVAAWLTTNNYSSVEAAMLDGNKDVLIQFVNASLPNATGPAGGYDIFVQV